MLNSKPSVNCSRTMFPIMTGLDSTLWTKRNKRNFCSAHSLENLPNTSGYHLEEEFAVKLQNFGRHLSFDTAKENNYLSCSTKVKSEIVVPIFKNNAIVGELDIDSHSLSPFTLDDEEFLMKLSAMVSELF